MIVIYKLMMGKDYLDREDLLVWDTRETRGHGRKVKKSTCRRDMEMKSFPQGSVDIWNGLDQEVVQAKSITAFKDKLDKSRHGDRTVPAEILFPKSQQGKHTHRQALRKVSVYIHALPLQWPLSSKER